MDADSATNAATEEHLQVEESDDSSRVDFIKIVSVANGADGSCTTECISGNLFDVVRQENMAVMEEEPDNVCHFTYAV